MTDFGVSLAVSLISGAVIANCCTPTKQQVVVANPVVQIDSQTYMYQTTDPNNPALLDQRYKQIQQIGLSCGQKDQIENYLDHQIQGIPNNPEVLNPQQRRVNSAARTKIWQLRTYCR